MQFFSSVNEAVQGCDSLLTIAPKSFYDKKTLENAVPGTHWKLLSLALAETKPGRNGTTVTTQTGEISPRQTVAIVLPDVVSRGNTPTRKEGIFKLSDALDKAKNPAVVLGLDSPSHYRAAVGALARRLRRYTAKSNMATPRHFKITAIGADGKVIPPPSDLADLADSVAWACQMVDTPPANLNPATLAQSIRERVSKLPQVSFREIVGEDLLKHKLGGIHAVGRAAVEAPRMIILDYNPAGAQKTIALIGKGVTFDTGGLCLKGKEAIVGMKMDMGGAAAVLGAFNYLARSQCPHRIIAAVGLVENAIGPTAYKPDDILTLHSGKTVEINNTDAEGRLVLADCLSLVCREYKPDLAIEAATLTGAQLTATGLLHSAIITNQDHLESYAMGVGKTTGDLVAPLPFAPEFFEKEFDSEVADMKNSVKNRTNAPSSCAAWFIYSHVEDLNINWIHIDMAGPVVNEKGLGTGYGVMLVAELARQYEGK